MLEELEDRNLLLQIDRATIEMFRPLDMKEINQLIIRNNKFDQYTTYNFPLMPSIGPLERETLRTFEHFWS